MVVLVRQIERFSLGRTCFVTLFLLSPALSVLLVDKNMVFIVDAHSCVVGVKISFLF